MRVWNSGYISEVDYIYGYFSELSPTRLKLALLSRGIAHSVGASPNYLELGFGQGVSLNINAATGSGTYYGTDFNPSQAAHAMQLANASARDVHVFDQSFEAFSLREDLPEFDIIVLHGIWSWIAPAGREAILRTIDRRLRPGGILYISYNVMPGWSPAAPLRHLLNEYSRRGATGGILSRVEQSLDFAGEVIAAGAAYFEANPSLAERLSQIRTQDRNYVTHEYFNQHWNPEPFGLVQDALAEVKLSFCASANITDNLNSIAIPANARPIIDRLDDDAMRETVRDYFVNQQFRRDIFVKGPRRMTIAETMQQVRKLSFMPLGSASGAPSKVKTGAGEAELRAEVYGPVVEVLTGGVGPVSFPHLVNAPVCAGLSEWQIWEALLILTAVGFIAPTCDSDSQEDDLRASHRLNSEICNRARFVAHTPFLAAPRIGSALSVGRIEQLMLLAMGEAKTDVPGFVWAALNEQGERLLQDGAALEGEEANKARIAELFAEFQEHKLPSLRAVGACAAKGAPFES